MMRLRVPSLRLVGCTFQAGLSVGVFQSLQLFRSKSTSSKRWLDRQKNDHFTRAARHENLKSRAAFKLLQLDERFGIFHGDHPLNVVDLGAAPGAWNQVALERCPKRSRILGVDILPYQPPRGVSAMQANILSKRTHEQIRQFFSFKGDNSTVEEMEITTGSGESITVTTTSVAETAAVDDTPTPQYKYPLDLVLSDMYVPFAQVTGYSISTTNTPYYRMANTSGLAVRDHAMSMDLCDAALIVAIDLLKTGGTLVIKFFTGNLDQDLEKRLLKVFKKVHRFKPAASRSESKECYFVCQGKYPDVDKVEVFSVA